MKCLLLLGVCVYHVWGSAATNFSPTNHPTKGNLRASLRSLRGKGTRQQDTCITELLNDRVWKTLLSISKRAPLASKRAINSLEKLFDRSDLFASKSCLNLIAVGIAKLLNIFYPNQIKKAVESGNVRVIGETAVDLLCVAEHLKENDNVSYEMQVDIFTELHKILERLLSEAFPKLSDPEKEMLKTLKENSVNVEFNKYAKYIIIALLVLLFAGLVVHATSRRRKR